MKKKIFFLMIWLSFLFIQESIGQNRYRTLSNQRSRYQANQSIQLNGYFNPRTLGVGGGYNYVLRDFFQVGGNIQLGQLKYASYHEKIITINLEGQYDFLHLLKSNIILSGLGRIGLERTFVSSQTEIVLDRNYPFKVIPQIGINADGYIMKDVALFANFTQGYVVSSSYLDNWRYRINAGVKYLIGK